ncbi:LysM peptidoglycan-binding domain-containing protein [Polaromonas sp.]|uniref:LysM peptidoglycan-binding domain-containing protein n=1 Tax=Polaromonas sp. TaxID=1869339 RepID=UPI00356A9F1E
MLVCTAGLHAQNFPITPGQRAIATQVAQTGVPLADLSPTAPDEYTVKRGDTLWAISGMFLKSPWRWPELWGMNLEDIRNPHRIYPGQQLYLDKSNGRATLRTRRGADGASGDTVRVSPRTRYESLADAAVPTLSPQAIEPFLSEALIVDEVAFATAPRIVATQEGRVLLSRGDRAYARGAYSSKDGGTPLSDAKGQPIDYRVFRNATPLKDPSTGEILGYEAQFVGKAELVRGETTASATGKDGKVSTEIVPATIDIVVAKEEMRIGDRLVAEPPRELLSYVPRAPSSPIDGQIVSIYGSAVRFAAGNQVVVINRGSRDGLERGHVMAILQSGVQMTDRTDSPRTQIRLPNERNGLLIVFRTFEKLSYALVLQVSDGAKVGDRVVNPN